MTKRVHGTNTTLKPEGFSQQLLDEQLGYWKHPPLPWWIADLAYRLVPDVRVVYVLGPLSAVVYRAKRHIPRSRSARHAARF